MTTAAAAMTTLDALSSSSALTTELDTRSLARNNAPSNPASDDRTSAPDAVPPPRSRTHTLSCALLHALFLALEFSAASLLILTVSAAALTTACAAAAITAPYLVTIAVAQLHAAVAAPKPYHESARLKALKWSTATVVMAHAWVVAVARRGRMRTSPPSVPTAASDAAEARSRHASAGGTGAATTAGTAGPHPDALARTVLAQVS
ncbi:hypothetical protein AMAG_00249 [Allomyces macrogynus ATCC 38327]|uniref:Uncharacterized protein n=1 Tax=Allomyces macrogynus (strain ATCC 38327) TaxID=578462 RepID=A0A0L0RV01_ALLM3|nr:hypothetical protein AMAG_00249 [Allomyces macrogynus ATCC 38327]|eukprot:KNE54257.1 hypothetical protein AMAG_00249 [Allomyces macrogynus ATCC 38327]